MEANLLILQAFILGMILIESITYGRFLASSITIKIHYNSLILLDYFFWHDSCTTYTPIEKIDLIFEIGTILAWDANENHSQMRMIRK